MGYFRNESHLTGTFANVSWTQYPVAGPLRAGSFISFPDVLLATALFARRGNLYAVKYFERFRKTRAIILNRLPRLIIIEV